MDTSSNTQCAFRQLWKKYGVKRRRHDLSSVFMTVDDPDTRASSVLSCGHFESQLLNDMHCVGPGSPRGSEHSGPCLVAETGHHLGDTIPPIIHLVLLAVFMTVENADTWHPQFCSPVTFESQRLTNDSPMVNPSDALRHCDVRNGEPRDL